MPLQSVSDPLLSSPDQNTPEDGSRDRTFSLLGFSDRVNATLKPICYIISGGFAYESQNVEQKGLLANLVYSPKP